MANQQKKAYALGLQGCPCHEDLDKLCGKNEAAASQKDIDAAAVTKRSIQLAWISLFGLPGVPPLASLVSGGAPAALL